MPQLSSSLWPDAKSPLWFQSGDAAEVAAVRTAADEAGLLGSRVFAAQQSPATIRLADNLADGILVAASSANAVEDRELLRALRPRAIALVGDRKLVKPVPDRIRRLVAPLSRARQQPEFDRPLRPGRVPNAVHRHAAVQPDARAVGHRRRPDLQGDGAHRAQVESERDAEHAAVHQRLQRHDPVASEAVRRIHDPPQHDDRHRRRALHGRSRVVQGDRRPHGRDPPRNQDRCRPDRRPGLEVDGAARETSCTHWSAIRRSPSKRCRRSIAGSGTGRGACGRDTTTPIRARHSASAARSSPSIATRARCCGTIATTSFSMPAPCV